MQLPQSDAREFTDYQENAVVSLALDFPEFFLPISRFMRPEMFQQPASQYVMAVMLNYAEAHSAVPTRDALRDMLEGTLTADDSYQAVLELADAKTNHRDVHHLKDKLIEWAKRRAYGLLYADEAQDAYFRGDYQQLEELMLAAQRITDFSDRGISLFDQLDHVLEERSVEHRTTGFSRLDEAINGGGPSPGEVFCFLAPTNVGKSILLCNVCMSSYSGRGQDGQPGQDVLLVTFELDTVKTALRCLGVATGVQLTEMYDKKEQVKLLMGNLRGAAGDRKVYIYEYAPDECSVNHLYALIDSLKRMRGWAPDVIVVDYLDLMVSRNAAYNKDDYARQKHVATELRGLAKNTRTVVFTATQTNRSASDSIDIDLNQMAESYGKAMPLDYVVSLNQTDAHRAMRPPRIDMYVAKNRNGPKHLRVECEIHYDTMRVQQL